MRRLFGRFQCLFPLAHLHRQNQSCISVSMFYATCQLFLLKNVAHKKKKTFPYMIPCARLLDTILTLLQSISEI